MGGSTISPDGPVAAAKWMENKEDLAKYSFSGDFLFWDKEYPDGCPTHQEVCFGFKPFCFDSAREKGYRYVLWFDASIKVKHPIGPRFECIREDGYLIFEEEHSVGEYCTDEALGPLGITRKESFAMPSAWAGVIGLDLENERSVDFLIQWRERASDGITFSGFKWSGVKGWRITASQDPRVNGHRFDRTAASVIAIKLGMDNWKTKDVYFTYLDDEREFVRELQENRRRTVREVIRDVSNRLRLNQSKS